MKIKLNYNTGFKKINRILLVVELALLMFFLLHIDNTIVRNMFYLLMLLSIINYFTFNFNNLVLKQNVMYTRRYIGMPLKMEVPYDKIKKIIITKYLIFFMNEKGKEVFLIRKAKFKENEIPRLIGFFNQNTKIPIIKKRA